MTGDPMYPEGWNLRDLYMSGFAIGSAHGEWSGYQRGYADGHAAAQLTDEEFLDALTARIRWDDELRAAVQAVMRSTRTAITVEANRRKTNEGRRAA